MGLGSEIRAATGFQSNGLDLDVIRSEFLNVLGSEEKSLEFIQSRLRSGKDVYLKGGHVVMKYSDRKFSLTYDNKRLIIDKDVQTLDLSKQILDSIPMPDIDTCESVRCLSKMLRGKEYNRNLSRKLENKNYKTIIETAVRTFIKGLLAEEPMFGLDRTIMSRYSSIIKFVQDFEGLQKMPLSKSSISHLKNRRCIIKTVPRSTETIEFANYIKDKFPNFVIKDFLR